jgi:hypothetical protein
MATDTSGDVSESGIMSRPAILAMPSELIRRVTSFLDTEMLPAIRLKCKAFEDATFDRFADTHFAHLYCCIFQPTAFHRLKDILQNSPTLKTRIRRVTLTDNALENQQFNALHVVRARNEVDDEWRRFFMNYNLHQGDDLGTGHVLMHRVLRDLKALPQDILVDVDLTHHHDLGVCHKLLEPALQSVLFSLALSNTAVHSLAIENTSFEYMDDTLAHGRDDFMASMSSITSLTCTSEYWLSSNTPVRAVLIDIFHAIKTLQYLTLEVLRPSNTEEYVGRCFGLLQMPQDIWLAIDFSNLASLTLRHVILNITQQD